MPVSLPAIAGYQHGQKITPEYSFLDYVEIWRIASSLSEKMSDWSQEQEESSQHSHTDL